MANEIDLYHDLEMAERFLKYAIEKSKKDKGWISTIETTKKQIKYIIEEIKTNYPDLSLDNVNNKKLKK